MIKVLIVDDEKDLTDSNQAFLQRRIKGQVHSAYNPKDAFRLIDEHAPNVLLIDLSLEDTLNGIDVINKAKTVNPKAKAYIVTGNDAAAVRSDYDVSQVDDIIEKPLPLMDMLNLVLAAGKDFSEE